MTIKGIHLHILEKNINCKEVHFTIKMNHQHSQEIHFTIKIPNKTIKIPNKTIKMAPNYFKIKNRVFFILINRALQKCCVIYYYSLEYKKGFKINFDKIY